MKFKWPSKYACKIGLKLVKFTANWTYITEDNDLIEVLKTLPNVSVLEETKKKVEPKVEPKVEIEVEPKVELSLEEASAKYEDKFEKKVPNNKKNDLTWIIKKLEE